MNTTTIFVRDLIVVGTHGAHLTTAKPKEFRVDMAFEVEDISEALATDDITRTYDYRHAVAIARRIIEGPSVHLIETLATRIAKEVIQHPKVTQIKITLSKREIGDIFDSGITFTMGR